MGSESAIISFLGAAALLVYAMSELSRHVQLLAGSQVREWVQLFAKNRFGAYGVGVVFAALMNSSSAVTLLFVALTNARMLSIAQSFPAMLGAGLGSTFLLFFFALRIRSLGFLLILLGALMTRLVTSARGGHVARLAIATGLLFLSLALLGDSVAALEGDPLFKATIPLVLERPVALFILGLALTAVVHSSAATVAFAMSFAVAHNDDVSLMLPWVLGANVGTALVTFLHGLGPGVAGRQAALANFFSRAAGAALAIPLLPYAAQFLRTNVADIGLQVACAHMLFNFGLGVLLLPISPFCVLLVQRLFPAKTVETSYRLVYLDEGTLPAPDLALAQAQREILRLADAVEQMFDRSFELLARPSGDEIDSVKATDQLVDYLNRGIKLYLTKLSRTEMTTEQSQREFQLLLRTNDLENIGDILDRNVLELVRKKMERRYRFSDEGWADLRLLQRKVSECLRTSNAFFASNDRELLVKVLVLYGEIEDLCLTLSERHVQRLHQQVPQSLETTSIHWDLIGYLQRIAALSVNVCRVYGPTSEPKVA